MPEPSRTLPQIVEELHRALEASPDLDSGVRSALQEAMGEIRSALDESDDSPGDLSESLRERLSEALNRFEGSHPRLTETVKRLVDQLSEIGI